MSSLPVISVFLMLCGIAKAEGLCTFPIKEALQIATLLTPVQKLCSQRCSCALVLSMQQLTVTHSGSVKILCLRD